MNIGDLVKNTVDLVLNRDWDTGEITAIIPAGTSGRVVKNDDCPKGISEKHWYRYEIAFDGVDSTSPFPCKASELSVA